MFALKLTHLSKYTARPKIFDTWPNAFRDIVLLFALGLAIGSLLLAVDIHSAFHRPAETTAKAARPAAPALRSADDVASLAPAATPIAAGTETRLVPLVGDGNEGRDALRRGVIVTARHALISPCDADGRVAFQITLRDYARSFAENPAIFRTTLDNEVTRAVALAFHGGLIDPNLVERWRGSERSGLASVLAHQGLSLGAANVTSCRSG